MRSPIPQLYQNSNNALIESEYAEDGKDADEDGVSSKESQLYEQLKRQSSLASFLPRQPHLLRSPPASSHRSNNHRYI